MDEKITITKRISKMGDNSIIVVPKALKGMVSPGDLVEVQLKVIDKAPETKKAKTKKKAPEKEDPKLNTIIGTLVEKGYSFENIEKVLIDNGYSKPKVKKAIKAFKDR